MFIPLFGEMALIGLMVSASADELLWESRSRPLSHTTASSERDPCIIYTYDTNGNRLSQTITVSGGGMTPTWGSGIWGCFRWTP